MQIITLTHLSCIEFGPYSGRTVEEMMTDPRGKHYMTWLYYNASHIDMSDGLMKDLGINKPLLKPGKDPGRYAGLHYTHAPFSKNVNNRHYSNYDKKSIRP